MIPRIREVHIHNYKSIAQAVVPLSDLTLLVGPNGSGKTNFVDALAFMQDCLSESIEVAVATRNGMEGVRRWNADLTQPVGIRVIVDLDAGSTADYGFAISALNGPLRVTEERCVIARRDGVTNRFAVREGIFHEEIPGIRPRMEPARLALYAASATEEFRAIYECLTDIRAYRIDPEAVGDIREVASGSTLKSDGGNAAAVLQLLQKEHTDRFERVSRLVRSVVTGLKGLRARSVGPFELIEIEESGTWHPAFFMSEGTRRLLGLLLASYQPHTPSLLMIEEPEVAIHPAAAEVVMSVLMDAAKRMQVLVTTHSPDILDHKSLGDDSIRVVAKVNGTTTIAPVAASSRQAIRERLYSPGELLRSDELNADLTAAANLSKGADLFGPTASSLGEAA